MPGGVSSTESCCPWLVDIFPSRQPPGKNCGKTKDDIILPIGSFRLSANQPTCPTSTHQPCVFNGLLSTPADTSAILSSYNAESIRIPITNAKPPSDGLAKNLQTNAQPVLCRFQTASKCSFSSVTYADSQIYAECAQVKWSIMGSTWFTWN